MYLERQYIGICNKCGYDVFVEVYEQKLNLIETCDCKDNQIIKQSWWVTYALKPLWTKAMIFPGMLLLLGWELSHIFTMISIIIFANWITDRMQRIQNNTYSIERLDYEKTFISCV